MGVTWLARRGDEAPVVLKRIHPALAARDDARDRFLHEARAMARVHDVCVPRTLGLGEVEGEWFIAMEYIEGVSVQARLEAGPPFTSGEVARLGADGAQALLAAHGARDANGLSAPVIHRDVSPHNLLLGNDGRARLIDFGVASLTGEGESGGKYAWAAPEQLLDDVASPLSDQYSLGVVLWECVAGRPAFDFEEDVEVIFQVTEVGVPPLPASTPEALRAVVMRMTSLAPEGRFEDLREVRETLALLGAERAPLRR